MSEPLTITERAAIAAYQASWTHSGRTDAPAWEDESDAIRERWRIIGGAAANAVIQAMDEELE